MVCNNNFTHPFILLFLPCTNTVYTISIELYFFDREGKTTVKMIQFQFQRGTEKEKKGKQKKKLVGFRGTEKEK